MKSHIGHLLACACGIMMLSMPVQAGTPTSVNGTATLSVTIELRGSGVDRPASHEKNVTWSVEDRYEVKATMTAQKPSAFGGLHKPDAEEQAREADRTAAVQAAATNMQPMMEQAQKIMELCGDDEDCMQREAMKMAQGVDMNSTQMQAAQSAAAAASVMPEVRYQMFAPGTQSGTYSVKEVAHEAYYDAACKPSTEASCAIDTTANGKGRFTDGSGATEYPTSAMAEIDYQTGSLMLTLAIPGLSPVKKTVASRNPQVTAGTTDDSRMVASNGNALTEMQTVTCGECKTASGSFEKDVTDQLLGRPAKLVVKWQFSRP